MIETAATLYVWMHYFIPFGIFVMLILLAMYFNRQDKKENMERHKKETGCEGSFRIGKRRIFKGIMFGEPEYDTEYYCYRCKTWFK